MQQPHPVFITGGTGYMGTRLIKRLLKDGHPVTALVRKGSEHKLPAGATPIIGDYFDPATFYQYIPEGSVFVQLLGVAHPSPKKAQQFRDIDLTSVRASVIAAKEAAVSHFVYVSFCSFAGQFPLQTAKRTVEKHLAESGLNYTILQPTYFMEVWLSPALGFDYLNAKATVYGEGNNRISWIAIKDVASFAVASLDNAAARNQSIELGGPGALSPLEVVNVFETSLGKKFDLQFVPTEGIKAQKEAAQDPLSESFAALMLGVANGSEIDMKSAAGIFAVQLTSVKDYAKMVS